MNNIEQVSNAWHEFIASWQAARNMQPLPAFEPDPDWPSPCEYEEDGKTAWQPVLQTDCQLSEPLDFANVGQALDLTLNPDYVRFFTLYFSDNLAAKHALGELEFLQAWSESDFTRLQQNLIGHLLMKQKLKQAPTLFFALTDEEDMNLVIDNESGQVCLEYVGKAPHKVVAEDLASFIQGCSPRF